MGLDFDLSEVSSGIYGFLLVIIMLLRPEGLLPERRPTYTGSPSTSTSTRPGHGASIPAIGRASSSDGAS